MQILVWISRNYLVAFLWQVFCDQAMEPIGPMGVQMDLLRRIMETCLGHGEAIGGLTGAHWEQWEESNLKRNYPMLSI